MSKLKICSVIVLTVALAGAAVCRAGKRRWRWRRRTWRWRRWSALRRWWSAFGGGGAHFGGGGAHFGGGGAHRRRRAYGRRASFRRRRRALRRRGSLRRQAGDIAFRGAARLPGQRSFAARGREPACRPRSRRRMRIEPPGSAEIAMPRRSTQSSREYQIKRGAARVEFRRGRRRVAQQGRAAQSQHPRANRGERGDRGMA